MPVLNMLNMPLECGGHLRKDNLLGSFAWIFRLDLFLGSFAWIFRLDLLLGSLAWIFRLDLSLGIFRLGYFAWDLSREAGGTWLRRLGEPPGRSRGNRGGWVHLPCH